MRVRDGFGVAEALVALTVLSAGVLAVTAVASMAARHLTMAEEERGAARLAAWLADSLAVHPAPADGVHEAVPIGARWHLTEAEAGTRLVLEVGRAGAAPHVFETVLVRPPPRLAEGW